ncbi:hypothetical protein [Geomesophilobacter sediminis]|uniref:Carboxypeptidase regulatory-like domain-containing protein n=1 Tax=Geomesophilobacter sediminis TaxID=2798584 RepID=A0A8J7INA7_9BACT|nr:hypothetical protein [Geomesophilobacter sediminis]MBJ6723484.1 hypothetical protein [Geomesophilobacter sediminis]
MKIQGLARILLGAALLGLTACGGGGGGGSTTSPPPPPAKATTTISGTVQFPTSLGKRAAGATTDPTIVVQAYTLDGVTVGSPVQADAGTGAFSIPNLPPGVDYVLKSTKGQQVLKKLIEKVTVAPGATVQGMDVSEVSTTAVVIASQKLASAAGVTTLNLGEPTTLTDTQKSAMSSAIFTDVAPQTLEQTITDTVAKVQQVLQIQTAIAQGQDTAPPDLSALTPQLVNLVNMLNIVSAAVSSNTDVNQVLSGTPNNQNPQQFQQLSLGNGSLTQATTAVSAASVSAVAVSTAQYTPPPRVALDISTNVAANTLYGITFDVVLPAGASVALDGSGKPDMSKITLASGVLSGTMISAHYTPETRTLRVLVAGGSAALPTGKLATLVFSRSSDSITFTEAVVSTSDSNGSSLTSAFTLSGASS